MIARAYREYFLIGPNSQGRSFGAKSASQDDRAKSAPQDDRAKSAPQDDSLSRDDSHHLNLTPFIFTKSHYNADSIQPRTMML